MSPALARAWCALALLAACRAPASEGIAPAGVGSAWQHVAQRYDRDADGVVERDEYGRAEADFARLDADDDGRLTAADFPDERFARDLGIRDMPAERRAELGARYAARAVVLAYFRPEPEISEIAREQLELGLARLDGDGSGSLDAAEFARATAELPWRGPGDAWELLLAAANGSAPVEEGEEAPAPDGLVAREELLHYHERMAGPEGLLRGSPGVDPIDRAFGIASDGPPLGSLAPDFELAPPDGGPRVRLSSWRGHKAVALGFGSYT